MIFLFKLYYLIVICPPPHSRLFGPTITLKDQYLNKHESSLLGGVFTQVLAFLANQFLI